MPAASRQPICALCERSPQPGPIRQFSNGSLANFPGTRISTWWKMEMPVAAGPAPHHGDVPPSAQQVSQHLRKVARGVDDPHDPERITGARINHQVARTRDRPESIAEICQAWTVRAAGWVATKPMHGLRHRLIAAIGGIEDVAGDPAQRRPKLAPRPQRQDGRRGQALARRASPTMPVISASMSSSVPKPSRSLSASASSSEATNAARAVS